MKQLITLASRLKELRLSNNLTQEQIAQKLNITRNAYTLYETGKNNPTIETLKKLADIYKTSIDYIVGRY